MNLRTSVRAAGLAVAMACGFAAIVPGIADAAERLKEGTVGKPWLVYYKEKAPLEAFEPYGILVLDSHYHPPLRPLSERGKVLLGYISLGEVENHRAWYAKVRRWGILKDENPHWKGSYYVDLRDPRWTTLVIEELIPAILRRGFDGLFFDTLDNPIYLEEGAPQKWKGATEAAARLVKAIRRHYPDIPLMLNRGYALLPMVEGEIDMVLGESVYADYDFDKKKNRLVEPKLYREQVKLLQESKRRQPKLRIMTLDYWDPSDTEGIRRIYKEQRANGFEPYVATVELDRIVPEPK